MLCCCSRLFIEVVVVKAMVVLIGTCSREDVSKTVGRILSKIPNVR